MSDNKLKIYYFARCRVLAGMSEEWIPLSEPCSMEEVVAMVLERHPSLQQVTSTTRMALNCEFTKGNPVVRPGDEVAFIPPVSGGSPSLFELCGQPIETHEAVKRLEPIPEGAGGLATFAGIVRRHSLGREVDYLEYEAYGPMAIRKMEEIAGEATEKWESWGHPLSTEQVDWTLAL